MNRNNSERQAWHQHEAVPDGLAYMKINRDKEQLIWRNNATSSSSLPVTTPCVPARNECGGRLNVHTTHIIRSINKAKSKAYKRHEVTFINNLN